MAQHFNQTHTAGFNSNIKKEDLPFSEEYTSGACIKLPGVMWRRCYEVAMMFTSVVIVT